jgi:hypothetical protein
MELTNYTLRKAIDKFKDDESQAPKSIILNNADFDTYFLTQQGKVFQKEKFKPKFIMGLKVFRTYDTNCKVGEWYLSENSEM